ncbi:MAG TPA: rRNA maturation RNase YbeY [Syntrophorhabdaceae bacterium]
MTALIKDTQKLLKTDKKRIREITGNLLTYLKLPDRDVSILFVDNRQIRKLNKQFFGKDKPTNVISFSYIEEETVPRSSGGEMPCEMIGDIVISLEKAREEADSLEIPFYERLFTLIIHGLLHILGFHHEKGGNELRRMRYREKKLLAYVTSDRIYKEITL